MSRVLNNALLDTGVPGNYIKLIVSETVNGNINSTNFYFPKKNSFFTVFNDYIQSGKGPVWTEVKVVLRNGYNNSSFSFSKEDVDLGKISNNSGTVYASLSSLAQFLAENTSA